MALKIRAWEEKEINEQQAIDNKCYCFTVDIYSETLSFYTRSVPYTT